MTKKKLIITITSLCLVVVAVVAAVVGILAAANVTFNSKLNVSYTPGEHVQAIVGGRYQKDGGSVTTLYGNKEVKYGDTTATYEIPAATVELDDENTYVVFEFSFKNNVAYDNGTEWNLLNVAITDNSAITGSITVKKLATTAQLSDLQNTTFETAYTSAATNSKAEGAGKVASINGIKAETSTKNDAQTAYFYVLVERQLGKSGSWGTDTKGSTATFAFALSAAKTATA